MTREEAYDTVKKKRDGRHTGVSQTGPTAETTHGEGSDPEAAAAVALSGRPSDGSSNSLHYAFNTKIFPKMGMYHF